MEEEKENFDEALPAELCGVKFQKGWYYIVDKKVLEPYICEDEKETDYKSIVIYLDCEEYPHIGDVVYEAIFFTDIKHVGISGRICTVRKDLKDKAVAREEFLKELQETLPKLNLKIDTDKLIEEREILLNVIKNTQIEIEEINSELEKNKKDF